MVKSVPQSRFPPSFTTMMNRSLYIYTHQESLAVGVGHVMRMNPVLFQVACRECVCVCVFVYGCVSLV